MGYKMKNKKINICKTIFIMFFVFVLTLSINNNLVNANYYWKQDANANYETIVSGNQYIAYGSNHQNPVENLTGSDYVMCPITKSDYNPVSADFNRDGMLDIVVTDKSTNKLSIYNSNCILQHEIYVGENIVSMPVLLDTFQTGNYLFSPEIYVNGFRNLHIYEYNSDLGYFEEINSIYNTGRDLICLTCFYGITNEDCIGITDAGGVVKFDLLNNTSTYEFGELLNPSFVEQYKYNGLTNIRNPVDNAKFYIPFGFYEDVDGDFYGNLIDEEGNFIIEFINPSFMNVINPVDSSIFIAKHGVSYRIFSYHHSYNRSSIFINDLSGNLLFEDTENIGGKIISNWAVIDYDKDGSNEACFLKNESGNILLKCYESNLLDYVEVDYTGIMNNTNNFVMADFIPSKNVLGIATKEGIFYPIEKVFSTGYLGDLGFPITIFQDTYSRTPIYVYTDDDEGFIVYAEVTYIGYCGDGICQDWENGLSCPEDCGDLEPLNITMGDIDEEGEFREGSPCQTDDDCADGLKCEYGVCTKLTFGDECVYDSDCLSGICLNGKCTKASLWTLIDASKDQMYGDDAPTNNFLSLVLMIVVSGALGYYVAVWAGLISFFVLGIFFALVGWLSAFILIGMFLIGIILMVFVIMIGSKE